MGITVTLVSPGIVDSEIRRVDNFGVAHESAHDPLPSWIRVPAAQAAREILRATARGQGERIITGHGKVIVFLNRHFPGLIGFIKRRGLRGRGEPKQIVKS